MTTTHTLEDATHALLRDAIAMLAPDGPASTIPDAVEKAATDPLARIVAERVLERAGFDVLWHDLARPGKEQAREGIRAVESQRIHVAEVYGKNAPAILGILRACITADEVRIRAVGHQLFGEADTRMQDAFTLAAAYDCDRMLADTLSDVHFACQKDGLTTPAAVQAHLKGVRGFELAAAYYVLEGAGWNPSHSDMHRFLGPVLRTFFPRGADQS